MPTVSKWLLPSGKLPPATTLPLRFAYFTFSSSSDIDGWDFPYAETQNKTFLILGIFKCKNHEQTNPRGTHASGRLGQV